MTTSENAPVPNPGAFPMKIVDAPDYTAPLPEAEVVYGDRLTHAEQMELDSLILRESGKAPQHWRYLMPGDTFRSSYEFDDAHIGVLWVGPKVRPGYCRRFGLIDLDSRRAWVCFRDEFAMTSGFYDFEGTTHERARSAAVMWQQFIDSQRSRLNALRASFGGAE